MLTNILIKENAEEALWQDSLTNISVGHTLKYQLLSRIHFSLQLNKITYVLSTSSLQFLCVWIIVMKEKSWPILLSVSENVSDKSELGYRLHKSELVIMTLQESLFFLNSARNGTSMWIIRRLSPMPTHSWLPSPWSQWSATHLWLWCGFEKSTENRLS